MQDGERTPPSTRGARCGRRVVGGLGTDGPGSCRRRRRRGRAGRDHQRRVPPAAGQADVQTAFRTHGRGVRLPGGPGPAPPGKGGPARAHRGRHGDLLHWSGPRMGTDGDDQGPAGHRRRGHRRPHSGNRPALRLPALSGLQRAGGRGHRQTRHQPGARHLPGAQHQAGTRGHPRKRVSGAGPAIAPWRQAARGASHRPSAGPGTAGGRGHSRRGGTERHRSGLLAPARGGKPPPDGGRATDSRPSPTRPGADPRAARFPARIRSARKRGPSRPGGRAEPHRGAFPALFRGIGRRSVSRAGSLAQGGGRIGRAGGQGGGPAADRCGLRAPDANPGRGTLRVQTRPAGGTRTAIPPGHRGGPAPLARFHRTDRQPQRHLHPDRNPSPDRALGVPNIPGGGAPRLPADPAPRVSGILLRPERQLGQPRRRFRGHRQRRSGRGELHPGASEHQGAGPDPRADKLPGA